MFTTRFTNEGAFVFYNDNGKENVTFVANGEISSLREGLEGKTDPETSVELRSWFAAQSDYESVPFTVINESDYMADETAAIDAVSVYYFRHFSQE